MTHPFMADRLPLQGWLISFRFSVEQHGYIIEGQSTERSFGERSFTFIKAEDGYDGDMSPDPAALPKCCTQEIVLISLVDGPTGSTDTFYRCLECGNEFVAQQVRHGRWFMAEEDL